mgnify:CR=1 FL=1
MKAKLLTVLNQFNDLLPNVIGNPASVPDRIREIDDLTLKVEMIIVEKFVYEQETFTELEPMMNDDLINVFFHCDFQLQECGGDQYHERIIGAWYPLHIGIFHYIADSIFHLIDFYYGVQDTGVPKSYQMN